MQYKNAKMLKDGRIDCEFNHPKLGWIPFTASSNDSVELGRVLFEKIKADGTAKPYTPPAPLEEAEELRRWRASAVCTPLQGKLALGQEKWERVENLLSDHTTPWTMKQVINSASVWYRNSEDIDALAWLLGLNETQVDDLFRLAMSIKV